MGKIKDWWQGEYVPPPPLDFSSGVIFISPGWYELHWSSRIAHAVVDFCAIEWKWLITILVSISGIVAALVMKFY